jgi:hypothetical protein
LIFKEYLTIFAKNEGKGCFPFMTIFSRDFSVHYQIWPVTIPERIYHDYHNYSKIRRITHREKEFLIHPGKSHQLPLLYSGLPAILNPVTQSVSPGIYPSGSGWIGYIFL